MEHYISDVVMARYGDASASCSLEIFHSIRFANIIVKMVSFR
jgi:hypothetical protein